MAKEERGMTEFITLTPGILTVEELTVQARLLKMLCRNYLT